MTEISMKRVKKVKKKCANPLFEKWLLEWRDEAKAKSLHIENRFTKAIISLQKYPLPLETGNDCILLQYFGPKLCAMLDKKLKDHLSAKKNAYSSDTEIVEKNNDILSHNSPKLSKSQDGNLVMTKEVQKKKFAPKKNAHSSDSDIVDRNNKISSNISPKLSKSHDESSVNKSEIQKKKISSKRNAHSSDSEIVDKNNEISFDISPKISKNQNGNSANITEHQKNKFVPKIKKGTFVRRNREHSMSPSGSSCGNDSPIIERINYVDDEIGNKASNENNTVNKKPKSTKVGQDKRIVAVDSNFDDVLTDDVEDTAENLIVDRFQMAPNSFDVVLLVDNHETAGTKTKAKNDATLSELDKLKTQYEVRNLKVGDFGWIAKCRITKRELVLPYLVERKRMDDLASSIKDGRFHEQKFRLKQCGIPNIIYLLESHGRNQFLGMPLESLLQAATNLYVQDGCQVKFTHNHRQSIQYLSNLTTHINEMFEDKRLVSGTKEDVDDAFISKTKVMLMEFKLFNRAALKTKTFTVKEMFVKHLLQLKGISVEKALAIVELYPTPIILFEAFQSAGDKASKLLASIKAGKLQKSLGPALSKTVFDLYTKNTLD